MNFFEIFDHLNVLVPVALFSLPVYWLIGRYFFSDWRDFLEHLRFLYQPFWLSALRGEHMEDIGADIKTFIYFLICVAWVFFISNFIIKI